MHRTILKNHVSTLTLMVAIGVGSASGAAEAACVSDPTTNNLTCSGTTTTAVTLYDQAAAFQPIAGSNSYKPANPAFPAATNPKNPGYNPNPATEIMTISPGSTFAFATTTANQSILTDRGIIAANYSNSENPAVNNVTINNSGSVTLTTNQIAGRNHAIVADSQVNLFTLNNAAGATVSAAQTFFDTSGFSKSLLAVKSSNTPAPTPSTYTPTYNGATLNIVSALYSDDNTNSFVINNAGTVSATGRYAAAYYGRADTTITNSGTFGNSSWQATDKIYDGHWAVGTYAGADFASLAGSSPDAPIYDVQNITKNAQGVNQGTLAVTDTSATTITNTKTGTINGDILVLDTNPLVTAAAVAAGTSLPLAVSGSNSGPRDSSITNQGAINGNLYLGSGDHEIDNQAGATIAGSINVDQRPSVGTFAAVPTPGTAPGTYASLGPTSTDSSGNACPATNTTDLFCAKSSTVLASFVGSQTLTLKNEGTIGGDIVITDQATSVNEITLTGSGFAGNIVAVNGLGSNSLILNDVTNLASVQNFSSIALNQSNVAVTNGVSLVNNATISTTVYGPGGTKSAPSTKLGTINGTLTLAGTTTLVPTFATFVRNGETYQVASAETGPGTVKVTQPTSYLVSARADTSSGKLLLTTAVRDPRTVAGITQPAAATLQGLLSYNGSNAQVQGLGQFVEGLTSSAAVSQAGAALSPIVNGADVQTPINSTMLFSQQIDSRLDSFIYALIPSTGRSADLGVDHPAPVYGVPPPNGAWIEGIGGGVHQSTVNGIGGYTATLEGVIGGYDRLVIPNVRIGGAFGYIDGRVNGNANIATHEDIQTYQGLAYATYEAPNYYLRGSIGYGGVNFQSSRQVDFANFTDFATGSHGGNVLTARGEGGVPYEYGSSLLVPYAAFTYSRLEQNAYTENSGNGAGLSFLSATNNSDRSEVGGKILVPLTNAPIFSYLFPSGSVVALEGRAAYVHEFGNLAQTVSASFTGGGNVFVAAGPTPSRDMVDYGVGLRMGSGPVQIDLSYNGLARSTYLEQVGLLRARYVF